MTRPTCPACGEMLRVEPELRGVDRLHGIPGAFDVVVCPSCGTGRTVPIVPPERLGELDPDDYNAYRLPEHSVGRLLATALFEIRYWKALRTSPFEALRTRRAGRLLDVGSGRGDLGVVLQREGWDVVGLEPSEAACEEARRRGVRSELGTLETVGSTLEGVFDAVVFNHSLEHVAEPLVSLELAGGHLRAGGIVIVSAPNFASWQRRRFGSFWFHLDLPRHRSHFTPKGLDRVLRRAGLEDPRVRTASTADGLPMSIQYRAFGHRRFTDGPGRYAVVAASLAAAPLSAALDRMAGGGEVVHAIAVKGDS
jgi:SAM-dependent methyltransferase